MNMHDSEKMAGVLRREGYSPAAEQKDADIIILNTCSIRQKAEQKFLSQLGRTKSLKKTRPGVKIAVAGCIAQQMGESLLARAPHVDYLIGPQNLQAVSGMALDNGPATSLQDNPELASLELPAERKGRGRAWVSIMYGCNNFCTYCIVPYTRGREKSRPSESIVREIRGLAAEGCREVTLLGQNVNSYRSDTDFPGLLRKIDAIEGIERVRFVTSHPRDFSDALIDAMAGLESVCEHIHLPLQSGSDRVLSLMNRSYTFDDYLGKVRKLRDRVPDVAITSDIIAGFPTETDAEHEDTLAALREVEFDGIFAFKFSPRPGTAASKMEGQLDESVKLERLQQVLSLQDGITQQKNRALEGSVLEVLVEGPSETDGGRLTGRTRSNKIVHFSGGGSSAGRLVRVEIVRAMKHSLQGRAG